MNREYSQNEILRTIDVSGIFFFVGFVIAVITGSFPHSVESWVSYMFYTISVAAILFGCYYLIGSLIVKRRMIKAGTWKKLSFKEAFDLHEWRSK